MNFVLRIVSNANVEITETISNLIFCVFATFFPEVFESINREEISNEQEVANQGKYKIKMIPIEESLKKKHGEKFVLFKNMIETSHRIR
jgi:hypothetical protein